MEDMLPQPHPPESSQNNIQVMVHPLSMVSMADHCTRCIHHGTPIHEEDINDNNKKKNTQPPSPPPPIVGLLFGTVVSVSVSVSEPKKPPASTITTVNISDAEDVPILYQNSIHAAMTAMKLHQAVYTNHICVGWYRVNVVESRHQPMKDTVDNVDTSPPTPTAEDLILSQQLLQQYSSTSTSTSNTVPNAPFIFALLNVQTPPEDSDDSHTKVASSLSTTTTAISLADQLAQQKKKKNNTTGTNNDNDIPLSLYLVDQQQQVLIGLDYYSTVSDSNRNVPSHIDGPSSTFDYSWKLVTAPYERIAVERIMEYKNKNNHLTNTNNMSPLQMTTSKIQQSLYAVYERLDTLECTLQLLLRKTTNTTTDASTLALLRHVNSLLLHVSMMSSILVPSTVINPDTEPTTAKQLDDDRTTTSTTTSTTTTQLLQQLVTLSETISTIQQYTDKLHIVQQYNRDVTSPNLILKNTSSTNTKTMGTTGGNPTMEVTSSRQHTRVNFPMYE